MKKITAACLTAVLIFALASCAGTNVRQDILYNITTSEVSVITEDPSTDATAPESTAGETAVPETADAETDGQITTVTEETEPEYTETEPEPTGAPEETEPETTAETTSAETGKTANGTTEAGDGSFSATTDDGSVSRSGSVYTVTSAGTYTVTGTLSEGRIVIDAGEEDEVTLVLQGADITCPTDSPIQAVSAGKLKIKAAEGTENSVTDKRALKTDENDDRGPAAIYAACDMNLTGTGKLTVTASYNNGVQSKDDLKIKDLTLTVTAPNNAIKGNDSVTVESGTVTAISTAGDGIKTDNSDVSSKGNQRGNITVTGGTLYIYSACDGMDTAYNAEISGDPVISILTHSYSEYTSSSAKKTQNSSGVTKSAESSKGIKADNEITVSGGTVTVKCIDDGLHANSDVALADGLKGSGNITVTGGSVTVTAADDGIHADGTLRIDGGYIDVVNSHEGLEGHNITVNDGEVHVYATDDGVNATSSGGRSSDGVIRINGGSMFVEVAGRDVDGIDSNGSYEQTGGFVVVSNPNADSSGNMSALDADGAVTVTGGTIIALGTVPGGSGGGRGGRFGMGGMGGGSALPSGSVTYTGTLTAGTHTFTYNGETTSFTLKARVSNGWIWSDGISSTNYTLK